MGTRTDTRKHETCKQQYHVQLFRIPLTMLVLPTPMNEPTEKYYCQHDRSLTTIKCYMELKGKFILPFFLLSNPCVGISNGLWGQMGKSKGLCNAFGDSNPIGCKFICLRRKKYKK